MSNEKTPSLSAEYLADLRAKCEAATPGPWETRNGSIYDNDDEEIVNDIYYRHDQMFIATARTAIPALLDEIARLGGQLESAILNRNYYADERKKAESAQRESAAEVARLGRELGEAQAQVAAWAETAVHYQRQRDTALAENATLREAMRKVKFLAVTAGAPNETSVPAALARMVRIAIDVGVTEQLPELSAAMVPGAVRKTLGKTEHDK